MAAITAKQKAILDSLCAADKPVSSTEIGGRLAISARTVRYNLAAINRYLSIRGAVVVAMPRVGLVLRASSDSRRRIAADLAAAQAIPAPDPLERQQLLLLHLLSSTGCLTSDRMQQLTCHSRSTIARDLAEVEVWLQRRDLFLRRRPGVGTDVVGREEDIRHALIELILDTRSDELLLEACVWGRSPRARPGTGDSAIARALAEVVETWRMGNAWRYMRRIERQLDIALSDRSLIQLSLYWAIMVWRVSLGKTVQAHSVEVVPIESLPEYRAVREAADALKDSEGIRLPGPELTHMALNALTAACETGLGTSMAPHEIAKDYEQLASRILRAIGNAVGADLENADVVKRLGAHLFRSSIRIKNSLPIYSSSIRTIRSRYPALWQAASDILPSMEAEFGCHFPREETDYVAMYAAFALEARASNRAEERYRVIVVCPEGGVTSWMLVAKLQRAIPSLHVVNVVSIRNVGQHSFDGIDAIITTAASFVHRTVPVLLVNPLLTETDLALINMDVERWRARVVGAESQAAYRPFGVPPDTASNDSALTL
jgi:mannitol operon transcriptional antiterminator